MDKYHNFYRIIPTGVLGSGIEVIMKKSEKKFNVLFEKYCNSLIDFFYNFIGI